jgi:hypothetical protein
MRLADTNLQSHFDTCPLVDIEALKLPSNSLRERPLSVTEHKQGFATRIHTHPIIFGICMILLGSSKEAQLLES